MRALMIGAFLLLATPAAAHPPELLALLRSPDTVVTARDAGERGGAKALAKVAGDATLDRYARMRAASSLGLFDTPEARRALADLADGRTTDDVEVRIQALASLTYLEKDAARPRLQKLLAAKDPELRAAAARNLDRLRAGKRP